MTRKARRSIEILMEARLVEARGAEWSRLPESFFDRGVALDYVSSLDPRLGPTVVMVHGAGSVDPPDRDELMGWWLCEPGAPGLRMAGLKREFRWRGSYRGPLQEWESRGLITAPSLMSLAEHVGVSGRTVSLAALSLAAMVLSRDPTGSPLGRSRERALGEVRRLSAHVSEGSATPDEAAHAMDSFRVAAALHSTSDADGRALLAASAAARVAWSYLATGRPDPEDAYEAGRRAAVTSYDEGGCVAAFRAHISTMDFLRACADMGQR